jgi:AcrR family transcriptional regulator
MGPTGRRCPKVRQSQDYLDAAVALLARHGPADASLGVTAAVASRWSGVNRSTLYRHWPNIGALNIDLGLFATTHHGGWQAALVRQDPRTGLATAIRTALDAERLHPALLIRMAATGWPEGPARRAIVAWERRWLDALRCWIVEHLAHRHRVVVQPRLERVLAVAFAALVEGQLIYELASDSPPPRVDVSDGQPAAATPIDRLLASTSRPWHASDGEIRHRRVPTLDGRRAPIHEAGLPILARCFDGYARSSVGDEPPLAAGRLVHLRRLAADLDVTERQLYNIWPSPAHLNAALLTEILHRARRNADAATLTAFEMVGPEAEPPGHRSFVVPMHEVIALGLGRGDAPPLMWCGRAFAEPSVRRALRRSLADWEPSMRSVVIAGYGLTATSPRAGIDGNELTRRIAEAMLGLLRLATLDPALGEEHAPTRSPDRPVAGLAAVLVAASMAQDQGAAPHRSPSTLAEAHPSS